MATAKSLASAVIYLFIFVNSDHWFLVQYIIDDT